MFNYLRPINTFVMGENGEERGGKYERQETWQWVYGDKNTLCFPFIFNIKAGLLFCFF